MNILLLLAGLIAGQAESPSTPPVPPKANEPSDASAAVASPSESALKVDENSPNETVVGSAATEEEASSTGPRYAITGDNVGDVFSIDSESGRITIRDGSALDFETRSTYDLTVEVTTTADPDDENQKRFIEQLRKTGADEETIAQSLRRTSERVIRVELADVNETPLFEEQSFQLDGNSQVGTVIGTLSAHDPDHGDRLLYSTEDEETDRVFAIDANSGEITLRDPEALRSSSPGSGPFNYQATFQVTDAAGLVDVASITIVIDPPPAIPVVAEVPPVGTATEPAPSEGSVEHQTTEPMETETAAAVPITVPMAEADPEPEVGAATTPEAENPQPAEDAVATTETEIETPHATDGSGRFSRFLNIAFLVVLAGGGLHVYRTSKSQRGAIERNRAEEARLAAIAMSLESQKTALENLRSQLEQEKSRLDQGTESLTAREQQVEALENELEAQRTELAAAAEGLQEAQASLEAERRKLAEAFQEIERHEQDLAERKTAFHDAASGDEPTVTTSVDAAEQLLSMAADHDLQPPEVESAEVLELRNRLADMFGVSETEFSQPRPARKETEYDGIVKADDRELARASSRPEPAHASAALMATVESPVQTKQAPEEAPDSVASYMQGLLERQRVRQLYGSAADPSPPLAVQRPVVSTTVASVPSPSKPASSPPVPVAVEPPKPISDTPVHPQDKDAVRSGLSSLREVANQAARSAVLKHAKKKLRNHSLIKIGTAVASFLTAGIVFSGSIAVTSMLGWMAVGIGGIVLIDLGYWAYVTRKNASRVNKHRD